MSISNSIANALSGLRVTGRMTEVASNNLANALTDGYGRQNIEVGASVLGGTGAGVSELSVTRTMAPEYTASRRLADGESAEASVLADAYARIGLGIGEADSEDSLFRRVEAFEAALRQFAETPESEPRQIQTIDAAKDVVSFLNKLSAEAAVVRQNADAAIAAEVATVNTNLAEIDRLNDRIKRLSATDRSAPTLIDERERLIDEINAIIPIQVQQRENNTVHLYTSKGSFLVQETAAELEFSASPIITAAMSYDPAGTGALSGLTLMGQDISPGAVNTLKLDSGSLAAHFAVRDEIGTEFNERIDQFAAELISRFENPTVDPTLGAGDPGLFTDNGAVLDLTVVEGLAGRIEVNALADPSLGGDVARLRDGLMSAAPGPETSDTIPRNLLDALTEGRTASAIPGLSGNLETSQMVSGIVELIGISRTNAETQSARLSGTRATLADSEAGKIGVNQDEELQSLIQIEQAYAANAQVIQTASRMLQIITEIR